jgi:hypothetical protein
VIVTIYHDAQGNIVAVSGRAEDAPPSHMAFELPVRSIEIQEPTLDHLESPEVHKRFAQIRDKHRVETGESTGRLAER